MSTWPQPLGERKCCLTVKYGFAQNPGGLFGEAALPTNPARYRVAWPLHALAQCGGKAAKLLWQRDNQLKITFP